MTKEEIEHAKAQLAQAFKTLRFSETKEVQTRY